MCLKKDNLKPENAYIRLILGCIIFFSAGGIISVNSFHYFLRFCEKNLQLRDTILTTTIFGTQPQNTRKRSLLLLAANIP